MILLFSFIGEFFRMVIPLPVPASVYGLVLLLAALLTGVIKLDQVEGAADFLIEIMPVMFIPAAVGLLNAWDVLRPVVVPVVVVTVVTTVLVMGTLLKKKFKLAIFNPLLIAVICVMAVLILFHIDYDTYNEGGQYISYLLTPATVSLAVPLYRQIELLKNNIKAVAAGILSGVLASMVGVYILARAFHLNSQLYVTLLPKSITTAIGMGVSEELGGVVTITVAVIVITGVLGNVISDLVCKLFRLEEPVAKGLALGTAAHAIGTAKAMELGEIEGAMSSLAIAVAGLLTVVTSSVFASLM